MSSSVLTRINVDYAQPLVVSGVRFMGETAKFCHPKSAC